MSDNVRKHRNFDSAVERFEVAVRMHESKDNFSLEEQIEIDAEYGAARQGLNERRDHIFNLAKRRATDASESCADMLKAQSLFKVLCRTPIGHNGPRGILPVFVQDYDPKIKEEVRNYERKDRSQCLADYVADEMEETLYMLKDSYTFSTDDGIDGSNVLFDKIEQRITELRNQPKKQWGL